MQTFTCLDYETTEKKWVNSLLLSLPGKIVLMRSMYASFKYFPASIPSSSSFERRLITSWGFSGKFPQPRNPRKWWGRKLGIFQNSEFLMFWCKRKKLIAMSSRNLQIYEIKTLLLWTLFGTCNVEKYTYQIQGDLLRPFPAGCKPFLARLGKLLLELTLSFGSLTSIFLALWTRQP